MKHIYLLFYVCLIPFCSQAQWKTKEPKQFQEELDKWYQDEKTSPFKDEEIRKQIQGLEYYPINKKYVYNATFHRTENGAIKSYRTSSGVTREMREYGYFEFQRKGKQIKLLVLESLNSSNPEYADYLTMPFFDKTNKKTTYGGGRYLGFWKKDLIDNQNTSLNFNLAYNPTCAYISGYSCLIPPRENTLPFKVKAGIKTGIKGLQQH